MKLSKLNIESFRHLENLDFDFTYPKDYKDATKVGKPLDKICFIGQSATGKTGLLELIYAQFDSYSSLLFNLDAKNYFIANDFIKNITFEFEINNINVRKSDDGLYFDNKVYKEAKQIVNIQSFKKNSQFLKLYFFKSNLVSEENISILNQHPLELIEKYKDILGGDQRTILEFSNKIDADIWHRFFKDILNYRKRLNQRLVELIGKGLISDLKKINREIQKFHKDNPNPVEDFALVFDSILSKLNLKVEINNTEYIVPIENQLTKEVIPIQNTSTGTKGLLLSFLPLYKLDTKDSIILIDEPERSLYPDMQMELMEHYQNLAPEAQFIVATHSPFIAASFEPEERFILYFDEKGKVAVRRGISPIGDDPNDMLYNDFGVNYYNKDVQKKFKQYIALLDKVKSENDKNLKKKYILEASKIGNHYNFILDEKNQERLK